MAAVPPPSSRYSDSIPAVADAPLATASSMLGPRPRTPTVVAAGLSTRARTAVDAAVAQSTQDTDIGVLTQHQRLHLQSWLNDCRRCATSGIHRAAFSGDRHHPDLLDHDQSQAPPLSLAPLVSSSLRSPISSSATDACISATTIQERRRASVEPQVHATAGSEGHSPLLQVTEQEIVYSPSVYSSSTEVEVHVHVDTPCGSREIFQGRGAFRPSLTTIEDIAPHDGQPQPTASIDIEICSCGRLLAGGDA